MQLVVLPLYSKMNSEDQLKAIAPCPPNSRKVVVATSIAESSVTIDGIVFVVDSGYSKLRVFDCDQSIDVCIPIPTSNANASQRLLRAGRVKPGKCYRIYSQEEEKVSYSVTEIHRSDLTQLVLILKSIGVENVFHFNYIEVPPRQLLESAIDTLLGLHFLDKSGRIQNFVHGIPLNPLLQRLLLSSESFSCSEEVITIISMLTVESLFISSGKPVFMIRDAMQKVFIFLH
jgi:ATP-dependent RNA helicase DHX8/PRP22